MPHCRAAGILASFLLIPQLLGAGEVSCPRHSEPDRTAAVTTAAMAGHEHHHEGSAPNPAPVERHPVSDCCPAMSTCSGGTAIQVVDTGLTRWSWHNESPAELATHTRSRVESPDPPPPKV